MTKSFSVRLIKSDFLSPCVLLLLFLIVPSMLVAETRNFDFEKSNPEYKKLKEVISPRIKDAVEHNNLLLVSKLSMKLLSDYESAITHFETYIEKPGTAKVYTNAYWYLAICYAHTGNFSETERWVQKAKRLLASLYWYKKAKEEIDRCSKWVPILKERIKTYRQNPSADNYLSIIRVYMELDEYGYALASINQMRKQYPNAPWFKTQEFTYFHDFLISYITAEKPAIESPPPTLMEKSNPRVAAFFQDMHKIEADKWKFCQKKWEGMSTIEKAKFVNKYSHQVPRKVLPWEPTEAEAEKFLREHRLAYERLHQPENVLKVAMLNMYLGKADWGAEMVEMVHSYLAKEERATFEKRRSEAIEKVVSLGWDAIPDLIATLQDAHWASVAGYEASWAAMVLSEMGRIALPALSGEFENASKPEESGYIPYRKLERIVRAIANMNDPSTIPILRKALKVSDRSVCHTALYGLHRVNGGLTEDLLLTLWQDGDPQIRRYAAEYLGNYGSERSIEALQKDLPTAYARAAYEIEDAIWNIRKRLGQRPGPRPEPPPAAKHDPSPNWIGIEKSLGSPNPGMRITALEIISNRTESPEEIQTFLSMARNDSSPEVTSAAVEAASKAFSRLRDKASHDPEVSATLQSVFHQLMQFAMDSDDSMKAKVLGHSRAYLISEDDEYFPRVLELIIKGMQAEYMEYRAESIFAFARIFYNREDLVEKYLTKKVRSEIKKIIVDALDSKYKRLKVDAISAVEILKIKEAQEKLLQIALNDESHHRSHALQVLEVVGDSSCIPALAEAAKKDTHVDEWGLYDNREQAWQAIKKLSK